MYLCTHLNTLYIYPPQHMYLCTQTAQVEMPFCAENVCLELDADNGHMYGIGSRSHVTFLDDRISGSTVGSLKSLDTDCGEL